MTEKPMTETPKPDRECGDCTACCQGWLSGVAHGREFYPGQPCHFVGCNGCSIYEDRPESPCKTYSCEWLRNTDVPEWMKPSVSNVIITGKELEKPDGSKQIYLEVVEAGKKIDSRALNWLFRLHLRTKIPIRVQVEGFYNWYESPTFAGNYSGPLYAPHPDIAKTHENAN